MKNTWQPIESLAATKNTFSIRHYDPVTGRFVTKDPLLFNSPGTNAYSYAINDPINFIDPSGLWTGQLGVSGSATGAGITVTGGFGIAIDGQGNITTYTTGAIGASTGVGASARTCVQGSNAASVNDLAGPFTTASAGGGAGGSVTVDQFGGLGSNGQPVVGGGFTIGVGVGGGASVTYGPTILGPIANPFK